MIVSSFEVTTFSWNKMCILGSAVSVVVIIGRVTLTRYTFVTSHQWSLLVIIFHVLVTTVTMVPKKFLKASYGPTDRSADSVGYY